MKDLTIEKLEEAYEILEEAGLEALLVGGDLNLDLNKVTVVLIGKKKLRALIEMFDPDYTVNGKSIKQISEKMADFLQHIGASVVSSFSIILEKLAQQAPNKTPSTPLVTSSKETTLAPKT